MNYDSICDLITKEFRKYYKGDVHVRVECRITTSHEEPMIRMVDLDTGKAIGPEFHAKAVLEAMSDDDNAKTLVESMFQLLKFDFEDAAHEPSVQSLIDKKRFAEAING